MESFNDIYDIESPRTSQRKMATIENSIQQSLLYNNDTTTHLYHEYRCFFMGFIIVVVFGIIAGIVLAVLQLHL